MKATLQFASSPEIPTPVDVEPERGTGTLGPVPVAAVGPSPLSCDYQPLHTLAFYRKHTHKLLRRYLYASILIGRAPTILKEPLMRGWVSHCRVETFEDCVIFVLDMAKCLNKLSHLDRLLINRVAIHEYSFAETALLLNTSERVLGVRFGEATDRLTEILLEYGVLTLPHRRQIAQNCDLQE